jgi:hypothetical protein
MPAFRKSESFPAVVIDLFFGSPALARILAASSKTEAASISSFAPSGGPFAAREPGKMSY